eukprot:602197-Rhodomonas_salina.1
MVTVNQPSTARALAHQPQVSTPRPCKGSLEWKSSQAPGPLCEEFQWKAHDDEEARVKLRRKLTVTSSIELDYQRQKPQTAFCP